MNLIGTYQLYSPAENRTRDVDAYEGVDASSVEYVKQEWVPILQERRQLAAIRLKQLVDPNNDDWQRLLGEYGVPDAHWNWDEIVKPDETRITHAAFCIRTGSNVEALMVTDLTRRCKLDQQKGDHLVYIENLAVAPWNRGAIASPRKLGGLGKMMLAVAVKLSESEGWNGRVGLHSLPQSESFYTECGFARVKVDRNYENLWYFELSIDKANEFLNY